MSISYWVNAGWESACDLSGVTHVVVMDLDQPVRVEILEKVSPGCLLVGVYGETFPSVNFPLNDLLADVIHRRRLVIGCSGSGKEMADGWIAALINSLARKFEERNQQVRNGLLQSSFSCVKESC